jgi:hypothetical protein
MMTLLEVKGAAAAIVTSAIILAVTVIAGGIYRNRSTTKTQPENKPVGPESMIAKKRSFFLQSWLTAMVRDADGGEDAPSLLKLQISGAHMALVIQSGIKGAMPSFAKKYNQQETAFIVAYLKTLR